MTTKITPKVAFYMRSATDEEENIVRERRILEFFISYRAEFADRPIAAYIDLPQAGLRAGPHFLRMCQDIKDGKIDVVMVSEINRISRSATKLFNFLNFIETEKLRFIAVSNNMDSANWLYRDEYPTETENTDAGLKIGSI